MLRFIKQGFIVTWNQPFAVITLFIYRLIWSVILYKTIGSIIVPILHRYPETEQGLMARHLFFAEGQFQFIKTDLPNAYIWLGLGLLAARMILHPVLNAGVYYSLANEHMNSGYRFIRGIKQLTLPYFLYYIVQTALTLLPLLWLWPKFGKIATMTSSLPQLATSLLPWMIGYLLYIYFVHLCFMYIQFGKLYEAGPFTSLFRLICWSPMVLSIAIIMLLITGIFTLAAYTATYIWAGLLALLIYQLFPLFSSYLRIWSIASQYELWRYRDVV
ncbi:hypothetical protein E0485_07625 [Paenibacillus albiflavus]|uniref:DUF975 family protein n=1 Tax=Paenibacillus albiflavus TaxID=2545760 RepID=A0A4R4EHU3_9BACL|nr:hypothetical protein [Paenibacillus albiflavus]TCZ78923.1 hypothetical protein E0485_07625 [Paenibacillus albiflavus]